MTSRRTVLKGGAAAGAGALAAPAIIGLTSTPAFAAGASANPIVLDGFTTAAVETVAGPHLGGERITFGGGVIDGGGSFTYDGTNAIGPLLEYGSARAGLTPLTPLDLSNCTEICLNGYSGGSAFVLHDATGASDTTGGFGTCFSLGGLTIDLTMVTGIRLNLGGAAAFTITSFVAQ